MTILGHNHGVLSGLQVWVDGNGGEEEAEGDEGADGQLCAGKGQPVQTGSLGFQVRDSCLQSDFASN